VLAGGGSGGDDLLARVGWGQHEQRIHLRVGQQRFEGRGFWEGVLGAEGAALRGIPAIDPSNRRNIGERLQCQGMRLAGHPCADDPDAELSCCCVI
jgi:hypothetical protein